MHAASSCSDASMLRRRHHDQSPKLTNITSNIQYPHGFHHFSIRMKLNNLFDTISHIFIRLYSRVELC